MKKSMSVATVAVMLMASGALFSDSSQALSSLQGYVNSLMNKTLFGNMKVVRTPKVLRINTRANKRVRVRLTQGKRYVIIAAGEQNVRDVDLYLYDSRNILVASDMVTPMGNGRPQGTDAGIVVMPFITGTFSLKIVVWQGSGSVAYLIGTY